jgi:hypothetical protein
MEINEQQKRKLRVKLKSRIGAEYRLNHCGDNIKKGINGKICQLVEQVSESNFIAKIEDEYYNLSRPQWNLDSPSGILDINLNLVTDYLIDNSLSVSVEQVPLEYYKRTMDYMEIKYNLEGSSNEPITTISINKHVKRYNGGALLASYSNKVISRIQTKSALVTYVSPDSAEIAGDFNSTFGVYLNDAIQVLTLLELPMCSCGCKYQLIERNETELRVKCGDCWKELYYNSYATRSALSEELREEVVKAQIRLIAYYELMQPVKELEDGVYNSSNNKG